jgi:putative transposase
MTPSALALPASTMALFRFQVVSSVLADMAGGMKRARAVRRAADVDWWFEGRLERVSRRTVYRWLAAFEDKGIAGLEPAPRRRTTSSDALSSSFLAFLACEKKLDVDASIPEVIDRAREKGILEPGEKVDRVTVWRTACRMGLAVQKQKTVRGRDTHRYRYPHRMQLILCDGKHFRAGLGRLRRMVYFFLATGVALRI